ncbi:hypothetical protein BGX27_004965 [Mortierella sp. AM989]|nr:hypothetical protein BGX27_004965 [Mortierella sp. AM989]
MRTLRSSRRVIVTRSVFRSRSAPASSTTSAPDLTGLSPRVPALLPAPTPARTPVSVSAGVPAPTPNSTLKAIKSTETKTQTKAKAKINTTNKTNSQSEGSHFRELSNISARFVQYSAIFEGGHYFSDLVDVSKCYGDIKSPGRTLFAIFICRAKDNIPTSPNIFYVERIFGSKPSPSNDAVPIPSPASSFTPTLVSDLGLISALDPVPTSTSADTSIPEMQYTKPCYREVIVGSEKFAWHNSTFMGKLARLYEIEYPEDIARRLDSGNWDGFYFHCTGNCTCSENHLRNVFLDSSPTIQSSWWCTVVGCPIAGILCNGFRMNHSLHRGHFFSNNVKVAKKYGANKAPSRGLFAIFICKSRDKASTSSDIFYVTSDQMQALDNCLRFVTLGLLGRTPTKIAATQYNESRFWELSRDSPKFIQYNLTFKHKLERLYQIEYTGKMARQRGHYFSDTVDTAKTYGDMKSPSRTLYGIFICDVRRSIKTNTNIFYVNSDKDIQPAYLAIVRRA